jgi:hypothetical protein
MRLGSTAQHVGGGGVGGARHNPSCTFCVRERPTRSNPAYQTSGGMTGVECFTAMRDNRKVGCQEQRLRANLDRLTKHFPQDKSSSGDFFRTSGAF